MLNDLMSKAIARLDPPFIPVEMQIAPIVLTHSRSLKENPD